MRNKKPADAGFLLLSTIDYLQTAGILLVCAFLD
jgi:hypothetical protein